MLYKNNRQGILASGLWTSKCKSRSHEDLVQCGFIAGIIGDYECAFLLFQKAARMGDRTASAMAGTLLAHFVEPRRLKDACFFFGQCVADPMALVHLGQFTEDKTYLKRAGIIVNMREESPGLFAMVGDLFAQGIKVWFDADVARTFYGVALARAEEAGEDTTDLILKILML
jgi:hypothetical protein